MCGVCGIINFDGRVVRNEQIQSMMKLMKHRGPDDEGVFVDENVGLGHVRLSIIDLSSAGHQPMFSKDGRYCIIHNGEVYNYIELREQLEKKYKFISQTDTEVILNSFIEWGTNCLDKFNGMFAFVIYDRWTKEIFAARDRFGIKPFYYYQDDKKLIFASEIQAILSVLAQKPEPDNQVIFDYLVFNRTDQTAKTFFKSIKKLQHGHTITIDNRRISSKKWYDLAANLGKPFASPDEYKELFSSAVGLRLRSDVPVGVCLSGGLDSSSITSVLINEYQKNDLHTFSAVYGDGQKGDESPFINCYSTLLKNMFYARPSADTLFDDLHSFINAQGEPFGSTSIYAQYKVMELAKEHVTVLLDGQGADEQLGGYHYFFGFLFKELLKGFRFLNLGKEILFYLKNHRSLYGLEALLYLLLPSGLKTKLRTSERTYLAADFKNRYSASNAIVDNLYKSKNLHESFLDHFEYKLEHLLKWEDRNSMWFSLESRMPFLDYRLVEKTLSLTTSQIFNNGMTKHILRQAMKGIVPEKIRLRKDKVGFQTPEDEWFRTKKFRELILDTIHSKLFAERGYCNNEKVKTLYQKHLNGEINISQEIWKWLELELWFKEFIDSPRSI